MSVTSVAPRGDRNAEPGFFGAGEQAVLIQRVCHLLAFGPGIVVVTGAAGTGKSLLTRCVRAQLDGVDLVMLDLPGVEAFLREESKPAIPAIVVVDDADDIAPALLLRLLDVADARRVRLLLTGREMLAKRLRRDSRVHCEQLHRIAASDVADFLRFKFPGTTLSLDQADRIWRASKGGVPALIEQAVVQESFARRGTRRIGVPRVHMLGMVVLAGVIVSAAMYADRLQVPANADSTSINIDAPVMQSTAMRVDNAPGVAVGTALPVAPGNGDRARVDAVAVGVSVQEAAPSGVALVPVRTVDANAGRAVRQEPGVQAADGALSSKSAVVNVSASPAPRADSNPPQAPRVVDAYIAPSMQTAALDSGQEAVNAMPAQAPKRVQRATRSTRAPTVDAHAANRSEVAPVTQAHADGRTVHAPPATATRAAPARDLLAPPAAALRGAGALAPSSTVPVLVSTGRDWLDAEPSAYTLQLLGSSDEDGVREFIRQQDEPGQFRYFAAQRDGDSWYVVTLGRFADRNAALEAAARLPPQLKRHSPWARSLANLRETLVRGGDG